NGMGQRLLARPQLASQSANGASRVTSTLSSSLIAIGTRLFAKHRRKRQPKWPGKTKPPKRPRFESLAEGRRRLPQWLRRPPAAHGKPLPPRGIGTVIPRRRPRTKWRSDRT